VSEAPAATNGATLETPALEARGIERTYRLQQETIPVLEGLDLVLHQGRSTAVVGSSGSGKTTMIHVLGLLDRPDEGTLRIGGEDVLAASSGRCAEMRNRRIGFVFQFYHLVDELTALENVLLPAMIGGGWLPSAGERSAWRDRARELLRGVGLAGRERHRPNQLSGGERQRVAIARALVNSPTVLFCDEPTGNLDPRTSRGVQDLLLSIGAQSRAMLLVTHDVAFARRCDDVLRLMDGRLAPAEPGDFGGGT
jgi:lipoprotein-releasing system ATP-binding protein